jgi:methyl-accepting chemotaxis protein
MASWRPAPMPPSTSATIRKVVQGRERHAGLGHRTAQRGGQVRGQISKGDIPAKITDTYNGDFNTIKNNLNQCIDAVNTLVSDAGMLAKAAVDGKLATRADASKHFGDYRKVVQA